MESRTKKYEDDLDSPVTHFDLLQEQIRSINARLGMIMWVMGIGFTSILALIIYILTKV